MDDGEHWKLDRRTILKLGALTFGNLFMGSLFKTEPKPATKIGEKEFLKDIDLIAKPVGDWDSSTGDGWKKEELNFVRGILFEASGIVTRFFGRSYFLGGTLPVFHLGQGESEKFKAVAKESVAGFSNARSLFSKDYLEKYKIGANDFAVAIATDNLDRDSLKILSGHEIAHACFNPVSIPPFNTHKVINLAIYSDYYVRGTIDALKLDFKQVSPSGLELYCWQMYRTATGKEFFAELMSRLLRTNRSDSQGLKFSEDQVTNMTEMMFSEAKMTPFSELKKNFAVS